MFERYTCWDSTESPKILRPLALEGNEAVFRATHSPISGLVITGTDAHDVSEATEGSLLASLSSDHRRYAMCVVEGEAGSGKSHLIRWLRVNWPSGRDLPILIERADGTLEGILRQLNEKLANKAGTNMNSIMPRQKLTDQGQKTSLLLQLSNLCRAGTLSEPFDDEDWCEKHDLANMLQSEVVRNMWHAPERVLEVLTNGTERDSKIARFTARDVLELKKPLMGLKGTSVGPGAIRLALKLRGEAEIVESAIENCPPGNNDPDIVNVAPYTFGFLAALNSRLNLAVQSVLGISGVALQKMFRDFRRMLKEKERRLVLLFEDLTGAQGIDQDLFYVLQERSTTQDQFCDLISVVGLTPAYCNQFILPQANVVQRITHHVRFGSIEGSFQAVSALENSQDQISFVARYLRALRAGINEIETAAHDHSEVINRCKECEHRFDCHEIFGHVEGVGLYPLTGKAIVRMFSALRDPKGMMFLQTPRALIQGVIAPSISAEEAIRAGNFPVPVVETEWHPQNQREVQGLAQEYIEKAPDKDRERLRTTVAWWGDGRFPTSGDRPEEWAGVPKGIFAAWGIPLPDSNSPRGTTSSPIPPIPGSGTGSPPSKPIDVKTPGPEEPPRHTVRTTAGKGKTTSTRRSKPKTDIEIQLERLSQWTRKKKIDDDGFWAKRATDFIKKVNWKDEDIPHWFVNEALGEVRLEGSGKTDQRNIVIPCTKWAEKGLEWSVRLENKDLSSEEYNFAIQQIVIFTQNIRQVVCNWVFSRLPEAQPGVPWQCEATVVQVLLARAWLRGETSPGAPLVDQWKVILSDDSPGGATKRPGAVKWNSNVERLTGDSILHKKLRHLVGCGNVVVDVVSAAPALRTLAEEGSFFPFPENPPEQPIKTKWLTLLAESANIAQEALKDLPSREIRRLRERTTRIIETTGATDFALYIKRAALAFEKFRQELPNQFASDLSEWFRQYESKQSLLKPGPEHDRLQAFLATEPLASIPEYASISDLLTHAIQTPAEILENAYTFVKDTSDLINAIVDYLEEHESTISKVQDAEIVVEFGQRIANSASKLKSIVQAKEVQS